MSNKKGISMISLIVTIICIVLLSSLAIGTGSRYLKESKEKDKTYFISVLSSAVSKRQEDIHVNSAKYPYLGYHITESDFFEQVIAPKVKAPIAFNNGIWYLVDTKTAEKLGVRESKNYIGTINDDGEVTEGITIALANYATGEIYLVNLGTAEYAGLPYMSGDVVTGHTHRFLLAAPTCTEPLKCADCGFIQVEATGHKYNAEDTPQPSVGDEENTHFNKVCAVCSMPGGYEPHIFEYVHKTKNGEWAHKKTCTVCGYPASDESVEFCTKRYTLPESETEKLTSHIITCRYCEHTVTELHMVGYRKISEALHEKYCTDPNCDFVIALEVHVDNNGDSKCDQCGADIIDYAYPQLTTVTMINKSAATDEGKFIAKYGDTIQIVIVANKEIQNLGVVIGGQTATNFTSSDNKTWIVEHVLNKSVSTIPDGQLSLNIKCETKTSGVQMPAPVTKTTDGKYVVFDSVSPLVDYVDKEERAAE